MSVMSCATFETDLRPNNANTAIILQREGQSQSYFDLFTDFGFAGSHSKSVILCYSQCQVNGRGFLPEVQGGQVGLGVQRHLDLLHPKSTKTDSKTQQSHLFCRKVDCFLTVGMQIITISPLSPLSPFGPWKIIKEWGQTNSDTASSDHPYFQKNKVRHTKLRYIKEWLCCLLPEVQGNHPTLAVHLFPPDHRYPSGLVDQGNQVSPAKGTFHFRPVGTGLMASIVLPNSALKPNNYNKSTYDLVSISSGCTRNLSGTCLLSICLIIMTTLLWNQLRVDYWVI